MSREAVKRAIDIAGGETELADAIGTSRQLVNYWAHRSKKGAAAEFVLKIESATGVPRHELRPDIYPMEQAA